jgi:hypothetical protein
LTAWYGKNAEVGLLARRSPLMTVEQSGPFRLEVQVGETWTPGEAGHGG